MPAELWLIAGPNGAGKTTAMTSPLVRGLTGHAVAIPAITASLTAAFS